MTAAAISLAITGIGVGVALFALLARGLYLWGRMSQQVDSIVADVRDLTTAVRDLATEVRRTNDEIRRTNEIVIALANHRHTDTDGATVFNIPGG